MGSAFSRNNKHFIYNADFIVNVPRKRKLTRPNIRKDLSAWRRSNLNMLNQNRAIEAAIGRHLPLHYRHHEKNRIASQSTFSPSFPTFFLNDLG